MLISSVKQHLFDLKISVFNVMFIYFAIYLYSSSRFSGIDGLSLPEVSTNGRLFAVGSTTSVLVVSNLFCYIGCRCCCKGLCNFRPLSWFHWLLWWWKRYLSFLPQTRGLCSWAEEPGIASADFRHSVAAWLKHTDYFCVLCSAVVLPAAVMRRSCKGDV